MNCTPQNLTSKVACFVSCMPLGMVKPVITQLLCKIANMGIGANLIPPGSVYNVNFEFDIVIQTNTTYTITWGANDVSATICGMQFASGGAGTQTTFASGNCTLVQLFGNAAGTTVTAILMRSNRVSTPGGTLQADGNGNVAWTLSSWPTGATAPTFAELWTSPDNVTYSLATTLTNPTLATTISPPAKGSFIYAKWRGGNAGGFAQFTVPKLISGQMCDWCKRVVTNGGSLPSAATQISVSAFDQSLVNGSIGSKMWYVLLMTPGGLIEATTPFYKVAATGSDPAVNHSFVAGDLTVGGLQGAAGTKYLDTGFVDTVQIPTSTNSGGITVVFTNGPGSANEGLAGESNATGGAAYFLFLAGGGTGILNAFMYDNTANNGLIAGTVTVPSFVSVNRTSNTACSLYAGDSTNGFRTLTTNGGTNTQAPNGLNSDMMGSNFNSGHGGTNRQISFSAFHDGLTSGQAQTLYNAVQTLRGALGGGRV